MIRIIKDIEHLPVVDGVVDPLVLVGRGPQPRPGPLEHHGVLVLQHAGHLKTSGAQPAAVLVIYWTEKLLQPLAMLLIGLYFLLNGRP